jgi:hypothetical protein
MALVKCRECKRKISDTAPACPQCGAVPTARATPTKPRAFGAKGWVATLVAISSLAMCSRLLRPGGRTATSSVVPATPGIVRTPSQQAPYVLPAEFTLVTTAERGSGGEIYLTGTTNLPDGTKLGAEVPVGAGQDYSIFVRNGQFRSAGFTSSGRPLPAGPHKVKVLTYFNESWQTPETLRIVGRGGANLKGKLFKREDPTVSDSGMVIDETRVVGFPPVSQDATAISLTKKAILTVDGRRSATDIEDNIAFFLKAPGLKPGAGWSAKGDGGTKYTVTYSYINGALGEEPAIWSVDVATRKVTYVNTHAKEFSWTPAE